MKKALLLFSLYMLIQTSVIFGAPNWKLPYKNGETWVVTAGYGGNGNSFHSDSYNGYYAIDFDHTGNSDGSIVAAAKGTVERANWRDDVGYNVRINHGDGYASDYWHMRTQPLVQEGENVAQGQLLGYIGDTGAYSEGEHLHFQVRYNGNCLSSVPESKPEPISGYSNIVVGKSYTSNNSGVENTCSTTSKEYRIPMVQVDERSDGKFDLVTWYRSSSDLVRAKTTETTLTASSVSKWVSGRFNDDGVNSGYW